MSMTVLLGAAAVLVLVVLILMFRVQGLLSIVRGSDKKPGGSMNKVNAALFLIFAIGGTALFLYYSITRFDEYNLPVAASEHGVNTDSLFWVTTVIISIAFIFTNLLLFGFAFKYQHKEGQKAKFFPDNHLLEITWTVIPALVLTYLVFNGWEEWTRITTEPIAQLAEDKVELEVVGQQFYWNVRYPGADEKLGKHYFKDIDDDNAFGLKVTDEATWDDFMPRKIYLAKGRKTHLVIRAKDVLHSVYLPHFRVKMDAMPGMPTDFWFTPTMTTQDMRNELGNQEFVYELACAEMCGKGHYSMRYEVVVLENDEYEEWLAESKKSSWALENAEYVLAKLKEQGAPQSTVDDFKKFLASNGADDPSTENKDKPSSDAPAMSDVPMAIDSMSVDSTMSTDSMIVVDDMESSIEEGEEKSGKFKNLIHKAGDAVENHREKRADKKGEEYEAKENKLHSLGDKVEGE